MKKSYLILSCLSLVNAFTNIISPTKTSINLRMQDNMNVKSFDKIDTDKSGTLDEKEIKKYYGNTDILKIGDLNNDKIIDYPEFERIVNIAKFGVENGGNLYVRNAIKFEFLKKYSILADGEASIIIGNKGFDPLNCATDIETLKKYREAEIKHGRLAMLAAIGWPFSELFHPYLSEIT